MALNRIPGSKRIPVKWVCQCECGNITTVRQHELVNLTTHSCGCFRLEQLRKHKPQNLVDMTGQRFGRLLVIEKAESKRANTMWLCRCDCGQLRDVDRGNLISGRQVSCGCHSREIAATAQLTHGLSKSKLYKVWSWIVTRCYNPKSIHYKHYGGRGIKMSEEWRNDFAIFHNDMSEGYKQGLQIDRIDVNGDYTKDNCRWATPSQNGRNKRGSIYISDNGIKKHLLDWAEENGVKRMAAYEKYWRGELKDFVPCIK